MLSKKSVFSKICVLRHGYYPEDPRVFKEVRAIVEAGHSVDVVCLKKNGQKRKEIVDGVCVYRLGHRHKRRSLLRYIWEYALSFSKVFALVTVLSLWRRYKCIQVNTLPDALVFVTVIPRLLGAKVILDMHEPTPELFDTKYGVHRHRYVHKFLVMLEQWSIKYANQVLTVNDTIRNRFIERGADGRKIDVVRNVPVEGFCSEITKPKSSKGLVLLTHGTIVQRYGHEVIIRALPFLRDEISGLHLFVVGDGENTTRIEWLIEQTGCSDMVTLIGRIPFSQICAYINEADIGVVPLLRSPFSELCQPNKMFEYIACKRAVVVSRLKAIEESFDDSCVMFFEPGNHEDLERCILDLFLHPQKRRALAENAYKRYSKMQWGKTKKKYLEVVEELGGERTR